LNKALIFRTVSFLFVSLFILFNKIITGEAIFNWRWSAQMIV